MLRRFIRLRRASAALTIAVLSMVGVRARADELTHGKLLFLKCASCHTIAKSASPKIGPPLYGVVGRQAGVVPGFNYSPAMKAQTFAWSEVMLDRWLTDPNQLVPGTAMAFGGLASEADRKAVIAYLKAAGSAP